MKVGLVAIIRTFDSARRNNMCSSTHPYAFIIVEQFVGRSYIIVLRLRRRSKREPRCDCELLGRCGCRKERAEGGQVFEEGRCGGGLEGVWRIIDFRIRGNEGKYWRRP